MAIKQKPGISLSPLQQKWQVRILLGCIILVLLWLIFAPGRGMLYIRQQKQHLATIEAEQEKLIHQNEELQHKIARLQSDKDYLEKVAREEYGMLKDYEIVFDFSENKKKMK